VIEERQLPILKDDEIQIKIHAASLNKADLFLAKGKPFMIKLIYGFRKPKHIYPGSDFSGEVIQTGNKTTQFKVGDQVIGDLSGAGFGAFAEMINTSEKNVWHIPKGYNFLEASALPMPMGTALEALSKAGDLHKKKVLVYGASGGVGRFLVQLVLSSGASVDAVSSTKHISDLTELGVSHVYDYEASSFSLPRNQYDVIFAVNGYQTLKVYGNALVKHGSCIIIGSSGKQLFATMTKSWFYRIFKKKTIATVLAKTGQDVLKSIAEKCEQTKINVQIGKVYPFTETSQAYIDFENHVYKGKYIIDCSR
jgi:NADPH:quinone reductase-like Zn-dependent oxidoreductase